MISTYLRDLLCRCLFLFDAVPRYGRLYTTVVIPIFDDVDDVTRQTGNIYRISEPTWAWWRKGYWGSNLLNRLGWLDAYIKEESQVGPNVPSDAEASPENPASPKM